ncbi:hypothetical protein [Spirosoma gilvum]
MTYPPTIQNEVNAFLATKIDYVRQPVVRLIDALDHPDHGNSEEPFDTSSFSKEDLYELDHWDSLIRYYLGGDEFSLILMKCTVNSKGDRRELESLTTFVLAHMEAQILQAELYELMARLATVSLHIQTLLNDLLSEP